MRSGRTITFLACLLGATSAARADDLAHFREAVSPLLAAKCVSCHGPEKQEGGLRLDSFAAAKKGGDGGPALVPGNVAQSRLMEAVRFTNGELQMPPKKKLADAEIAALEQWVKAGAVWPDIALKTPPASSLASTAGNAFTDANNPIRQLLQGARFDLWSLRAPTANVAGLLPDLIDVLIQKGLAGAGLTRSAAADRRTLLRRVSLDLTGLPPSYIDLPEPD